jgi:riboflavin kinase/FMN adenylyltransferase
LKQTSREIDLPSVVVLFEPQPPEFFRPAEAPARLMRLTEKLISLGGHGVDRVVCLRFDAAFASLSASDFVEHVLVRGIGVRHLVVGDDFRFGKGRLGDYDHLLAAGRRYGFEVMRAPRVELDGQRVSSSRVREALAAGKMEAARRLLGRDYAIYGRIVHGSKRGRALGFATLNIELRRNRSPLQGIFVSRVEGLTLEPLRAVTYIGRRPALGGAREQLEAHCFDLTEECYGRHASVALLAKLRDDRDFDSVEALIGQIALDAEAARRAFDAERAA